MRLHASRPRLCKNMCPGAAAAMMGFRSLWGSRWHCGGDISACVYGFEFWIVVWGRNLNVE